MPPILSDVYVDRIQNLHLHQSKGIVTSLVREYRIGLRKLYDDYKALLAALHSVGVPQYGDKLVGATTGDDCDTLVVADIDIKMVDGDKSWADVTIHYKHPLEEDGLQNLENPHSILGFQGNGEGQIYGRMRSTVQQRPVNFYYKNNPGTRIASGREIIKVQHDFRKQTTGPFHGTISVQTGTINVQVPQKVFDFSGFLETTFPWDVSNAFIATINSDAWQGEYKYEWMCTEVTYQVKNYGFYKFGMQFTHNPDTWLYRPIWTDPANGKPHPDAVAGEDYWDVHFHKEASYQELFKNYSQSWLNGFH